MFGEKKPGHATLLFVLLLILDVFHILWDEPMLNMSFSVFCVVRFDAAHLISELYECHTYTDPHRRPLMWDETEIMRDTTDKLEKINRERWAGN